VPKRQAERLVRRATCDFEEFYAHKRQFSKRQVHLALDVLSRKGWCTPMSGAEA
jgi:hypothetical protein